jgi:hypothetical protein
VTVVPLDARLTLFVVVRVVRTACPKRHKMEVEAMFPGVSSDGLLVIPTCQVRRRFAASRALENETPMRARANDDD